MIFTDLTCDSMGVDREREMARGDDRRETAGLRCERGVRARDGRKAGDEQERLEKAASQQRAQEPQRRTQEVQRRTQEAREREVRAQEERERQDREVSPGGPEEEGGKRTTREACVEGKKEETNSMNEEDDVSNRHMTWWRKAWWIRMDNGSHLRTARGRRRTWRAATRAVQEAHDAERTEEVQTSANSGT